MVTNYDLFHHVTFREIGGRKGARFLYSPRQMLKLCNFKSNANPTLISRADWSDKSEWYCRTVHLWSNKSGSIKERTQKSSEIRTGCQRNAYWLVTNHLLGRGLCSQSRSCRLRQSGVPEKGFALIRQLASVTWLFAVVVIGWITTCITDSRCMYLRYCGVLRWLEKLIWLTRRK